MKVKIGDKYYDSNEQPIMLVLDEEDKELISNMEDSKKYCSYPEECEVEDIKKFMEI